MILKFLWVRKLGTPKAAALKSVQTICSDSNAEHSAAGRNSGGEGMRGLSRMMKTGLCGYIHLSELHSYDLHVALHVNYTSIKKKIYKIHLLESLQNSLNGKSSNSLEDYKKAPGTVLCSKKQKVLGKRNYKVA